MKRASVAAILCCVLGTMHHPSAAETPVNPPVHVFVQQSSKKGAVTYRYRVVNGSATEIASLWIGWDFSEDFQLLVAPIGWNGDSVPRRSFRAPERWHFTVVTQEDDSVISACWEADTAFAAAVIPKGTTMSGFEVTLPWPDSMYVKGNWATAVTGGRDPYFTGNLEPEPRRVERRRSARERPR